MEVEGRSSGISDVYGSAPVLGPGGGFYAHTVRVLTVSSYLE